MTNITLKEQTELFAKNLKYYLSKNNMNQKELGQKIGVSQQLVNYWARARNLPRMDKIQAIANVFGISADDLLNEHNEEMEETLQEAFDRRPDMRILFSVAKDCTPQEVEQAIKIIEALRNK